MPKFKYYKSNKTKITVLMSVICTALFFIPKSLFADSTLHIDNPIVLQRADPFLFREEKTGCYYFIGTSPKFDEIEIRQACRVNELKVAEPKVIWRKKPSGVMSTNIWAPELHRINGVWYIYFAAGVINTHGNIRIFVLSNTNENPMTDNWVEEGKLQTPTDTFALDATTFEHRGKRYLLWAQQDEKRTYNSALLIAQMDSPTRISGPVTIISQPELPWEIQGYKVNEGAAVIVRNNKVFVTYSASATDDRYAMGLLWADANSNLLDASSWHKSNVPVFSTNAKAGRFGPGHNSFVLAEDGKTDLMIYHSRDYKELNGSPLSDPNRHARARAVYWDASGFPVFFPDNAD